MDYTLNCLTESWNRTDSRRQEDCLHQIRSLYLLAGWWAEPPDTIEKLVRIITGSHCFVAAVESGSGRILGMGRAISDGASDAYIQDVMVRPDTRGRGIASRIVQCLVDRLVHDGMTWIGLIAKSGTQPMYARLGFSGIPGAVPMLLTKTEIGEVRADVPAVG